MPISAIGELPSYPTAFREREIEKPYQRPDLSSDFLKEIDHQANLEREEKYVGRLRQLWDKYQQQENEIEQELFDEEHPGDPGNPLYYEKRQGFPLASDSEATAIYYGPPMEEKKRTMPILPWLPASRKKRFPVIKRSPKPEPVTTETDEKVAKDLQALFGSPEEKKKRSSGPEVEKKQSKTNETKSHEKRDASAEHEHDEHEERSSEEGHDEDEHEHEHEHDHEHDHEHTESSEEFEGEDEDKKKRSVRKRSNLEVVKEDQIIPGDIGEFKAKKSIQWNKYFGMDRRKKRGWGYAPHAINFYKTYDDERRKKSLNQEKLENMDRKLKTIEDLILDQTVKYTGDHEGIRIRCLRFGGMKWKILVSL